MNEIKKTNNPYENLVGEEAFYFNIPMGKIQNIRIIYPKENNPLPLAYFENGAILSLKVLKDKDKKDFI